MDLLPVVSNAYAMIIKKKKERRRSVARNKETRAEAVAFVA